MSLSGHLSFLNLLQIFLKSSFTVTVFDTRQELQGDVSAISLVGHEKEG